MSVPSEAGGGNPPHGGIRVASYVRSISNMKL